MAGWAAAGLDAIECLRNAVSVTKDWVYDPDPGLAYDQRIKPRRKFEKLVSVKWRESRRDFEPTAAGTTGDSQATELDRTC